MIHSYYLYEPGDYVKITPAWLDPGEDPEKEYIVIFDHSTSAGPDGRVTIKSVESKYQHDVNYSMIYPIGKHANIARDGHEHYVRDDLLSDGKNVARVTDVMNNYYYAIQFIEGPKKGNTEVHTKYDLQELNYKYCGHAK